MVGGATVPGGASGGGGGGGGGGDGGGSVPGGAPPGSVGESDSQVPDRVRDPDIDPAALASLPGSWGEPPGGTPDPAQQNAYALNPDMCTNQFTCSQECNQENRKFTSL